MPPKKKTLISGDVRSQLPTLVSKLSSAHASAAGPFDLCLCAGPFFDSSAEPGFSWSSISSSQLKFPIPTYFADLGSPPSEVLTIVESKSAIPGPVELAPNLFYLGSKTGLTMIGGLVVSWVGPSPTVSEIADVVKISKHPSYLGSDILLSSEWGQGLLGILPPEIRREMEAVVPPGTFPFIADTFGDCDIAEVASAVRPRYHFASLHGVHVAAPPYLNVSSGVGSLSRQYHATRFVALGGVTSDEAKSKGPRTKWMHAVGIETLTSLRADELSARPVGSVPSPYVDNAEGQGYALTASRARGIMAVEQQGGGGGGPALNAPLEQFRWSGKGVSNNAQTKRRRDDDYYGSSSSSAAAAAAPSFGEDAGGDTLFVGGLSRDPAGRITKEALLMCLAPQGAVEARVPPGKGYAFVQFAHHDQALACLQKTNGAFSIESVNLNLKWGSTSNAKQLHSASEQQYQQQQQQHDRGNGSRPPPAKKANLTEKDCADSSALFFSFPKSISTENFSHATELIRKYAELCLENELNGDGQGGGERVTAATEPAIAVTAKLAVGGKGFGFLGFASHAAAAMAIASMTGATDGCALDANRLAADYKELEKINLYWSNNDLTEKPKKTIQEGAGLNFSKMRYCKDTRTECWFCISTPSCEMQLVVDVGETAYIAMPKGPLTPKHTLIIPTEHQSVGCFAGPYAGEVNEYKARLRRHAAAEGLALFVFERAIETKGGLHPHVNAVPLKPEHAEKLLATAKSAAQRLGLSLREVQNDIGLKAIVSDLGPNCGYFYMEIPRGPVGSDDVMRLIHVHDPATARSTNDVPVQFGREIAAIAMGDPDKSFWKACALSTAAEESSTLAFRETFAEF